MYIVHISSVHHAQDPRIRHKQMQSIQARGWRVTLISGDRQAGGSDHQTVIPLAPGREHRVLRMALTAPRAIIQALTLNADIYHIHDPELLPWALLLKLKGRPVVYDIHEDYSASIRQKTYLPRFLRPVLAQAAGLAERLLAAQYHQVIAEAYYSRRFPKAQPILNYPILSKVAWGNAFAPFSKRLLYTGNLTEQRGALLLGRLTAARPDFTLVACGYCPAKVAKAMRSEAGSNMHALQIIGLDRHVSFSEIMEHYQAGNWLAGLALFPDSEHYREKQLTKFFEYMAAGLPIVASNFSAWQGLIQEQGLGLCVDAESPASVADALDWLYEHPEQARAMGQKGRELVAGPYNWERQAQRLLEFYQQIAK